MRSINLYLEARYSKAGVLLMRAETLNEIKALKLVKLVKDNHPESF